MHHIYKKFILVITLISIANLGFSQSNEIKIKFIGNCGMHMTDGKSDFYIDFPYKSGAHKYMKYDKAEIDSVKDNSIFIFTHRHSDHYSRKILKKFDGQKYDPFNVDKLEKLNASIPEFYIQAFRTQHKVFGVSFRHYSYLIRWHSKKIFISGDTGDLDEIKTIKNMDWAFVNPWFYMDAMKAKVTIDAKKIGLYHLYPTQKIDGEIPANLLILKTEGQIIKIPY